MADSRTDEQLEREIEEAIERGARAAVTEPRATDAWYDVHSGRVMVELSNGILFGFPAEFGQGLQGASEANLSAVEIEAGGYALHWEALDADLTVPGLVAGLFGSEIWMRELGRRGGAASTEAKRRAARINGRKGGRPRKSADPGHTSMVKERGAAPGEPEPTDSEAPGGRTKRTRKK